jgi:protoporphyrinogen oxidase
LLKSAGFDALSQAAAAVPYQGAIVTMLGLERRLCDTYWVNVMDKNAPFGALIEQSLINPNAPYGGPTLYVAYYPDDDAKEWDMEDAEIVDQIVSHLSRLFPQSMAGNAVRWSEVNRTRLAGLTYLCGVKPSLPKWRTGANGLFFTGMFKCYPKRPIDLVGADAMACADIVAAEIQGRSAPPWTDTRLPTKLNL